MIPSIRPYLTDMQFYLNIAQIAVSVLLTACILLQARGTGLSATQ
jgi:preprotein translocase subunit SecG